MSVGFEGPDFSLADVRGRRVPLSGYRGRQHIVQVLSRGFVETFCRAHMARLRHNYPEFRTRNAEVLVVGPDEPKVFRGYWESQYLLMVGLLDPDHRVADLFMAKRQVPRR